MKEKLDQVDIDILKILQRNSALSYKEIGGMINKSPTTVHEHVRKLNNNGFIKGYVAILNSGKLNQQILAFTYLKLLNYSTDAVETFTNEIKKIKEVCECSCITGPHNIKLKIMTTDTATFHQIEKNIASLTNVRALESYIELDKIISNPGFNF
jgi:DNA-binding Lrp family transcriptional regulator